ncbi:choice-of-anchor D domain-containing protein [Granulicella sp. L60]|uniref:choice-of-anchor D domain-containing protein n=1 Tax=Granulicella sp. L60 TaxID=1641866 RepID=UPI00131AA113|nr:choice-of-anchor D domain-containing protein [Granulicella sp. L60]
MPSSIPGIPLISRCISRQYFRSLRYGLVKAWKPLHLPGLMVMLLLSWKPLHAQLVAVNGPIALPATNVASSSAPQNILLKTTSAETISGFTVPVSQGNKQEYTVGTVTGCAVDGTTSNAAGTICTVPITFSPAYPGQRAVPLQAVTSAGKINIGLNGRGVAPLAVLTPGLLTTLAGEVNAPNCNAYSGSALLGPTCNPSAGAVDFAGNVYIASFNSNTVSKIDTSGNITVIAGTGAGGLSGVGGPATSATFDRPSDVVVDPAGNVYFIGETAQQVFRIDAVTHILTSVAGNGNAGYSGDNGPATQASLNYPEGLALDLQGNLYIEDHDNNLIRKVDTSGIITTVAGNPATTGQDSPVYSGDGGPATQANLALSGEGVYASYDSITVDAAGDLFIGDSGHHVVREVTTDGIIHTVAGNNALGGGYGGDGGPATSAQLNWPMGVAVDAAGDLYIADFSNNRIRKVDQATGTITTVAGGGTISSSGLPATQVSLNGPQKVVLDGEGNLYVSDTKNNLVRTVNVTRAGLNFPTSTLVGSTDTTDGPLEVVVSNIGNAPLALPPPATGSNASVSAGFTFFTGNDGQCPSIVPSSSAGTLAQGSSCGLTVEFEPASGSGQITGSIALTDNSLNALTPYATQTIDLFGDANPLPTNGTLAIAPATQTFTPTPVGSTGSTLTSIITNNTGKSIYLSTGSLTDAVDFTQTTNNCGIIQPNGGTCTVTFTFTPQSAGALTSTYSIHDLDNPASPLTVVLSGNGNAVTTSAPQASLSPTTADFGSITTGAASSAQTFMLSNAGNATLAITSISLGGANPDNFIVVNDSCATGGTEAARPARSRATKRGGSSPRDLPALPPGSTCQILVVFSPTTAGPSSATLTVVDQVGTQTSALTGTGVASVTTAPQAALTAASANFNTVTTGSSSAAQTFTLANAGNAALSISSVSITGANASSFQLGADTCGTTLAAGGSCTVAVTFAPTSAGTFTAALSVTDAVGTQTSSLTGTGAAVAPADFTVTATPASQSVVSGSSATYSVLVASTGGSFAQAVALTANGLPPGATVTFSPTSVTPGGSGAQATMIVQTAVQQVAGRGNLSAWPFTAPVFAALLLLFPGKRFRSGKRGWGVFTNLACLVALLGITASTIGCGAGFALPSSAKTYTITVTGTSGSDTHSTTVTLTVQ